MAEVCPDCGRALVASMAEFWKNPSYSCAKFLPRTECNDTTWLDLNCAESTKERLAAQLRAARAEYERVAKGEGER